MPFLLAVVALGQVGVLVPVEFVTATWTRTRHLEAGKLLVLVSVGVTFTTYEVRFKWVATHAHNGITL